MGVTTELKGYLHSEEFCKNLVERYRRFEILSEAGLRTAVANLLETKIRMLGTAADGYRVVCEAHLADMHLIPDVLIWKNRHPRIAIELKDTKHFESDRAEGDWQKIQNYCHNYKTVKAGYLIYVARSNDRKFPIQRSRQTMRCWPIPITLQSHISDFERWDKEYEKRAHYKCPEGKAEDRPARSNGPIATTSMH